MLYAITSCYGHRVNIDLEKKLFNIASSEPFKRRGQILPKNAQIWTVFKKIAKLIKINFPQKKV